MVQSATTNLRPGETARINGLLCRIVTMAAGTAWVESLDGTRAWRVVLS
jgi:hypothetical protein